MVGQSTPTSPPSEVSLTPEQKEFLDKKISIEKTEEDLLKVLLSDFISLKKFDDYIKVLSFYHAERCEHDDCCQCLFAINLRYVYTEHVTHEKKDVKQLRNYCIMRKEQFIATRLFIHRLAELEKQRLELEKQFRETLSIWNKNKDEMPSLLPNLNQ